MFNSTKKEEDMVPSHPSTANAPTIIAKGVKVEGDFQSEGDVVIEGEVRGTLKTTTTLTVGEEAVIKAEVHAQTANISGNIEGDIHIESQLIVKQSAKIQGDVSAETMSVEKGAKLEGRVSIGFSTAQEKPLLENMQKKNESRKKEEKEQ